LREWLVGQGVEVDASGPGLLGRLLATDTERWGAIARSVGARLD
jgi:hypothetical protein